jgi:hypothetical protein
MANDPGLAADTCIFMESVSGDGGVHNSSGVWWMSPDIMLNGPISGADKADPGQINPVEITFHRKDVTSQCSFPGDEALSVELWVGNPSIAMTPNNPASTSLVMKVGSAVPLPGTTRTQVINWTPTAGLPDTSPEGPGHKCLIARCYPDSLFPSPTNFFAPDDQHVAQRNICVVPCGGPGAAKRPGACGFKVTTANLKKEESERVTLRALVDLHPHPFVRKTVLRSLKNLPGFKKLATRPPREFWFELREFPGVEINDLTKPGCLAIWFSGKRRYEASIMLNAGQVIDFNFVADLQGSEFGDAYIFHLTQSGADNKPQGGLTLVMVST